MSQRTYLFALLTISTGLFAADLTIGQAAPDFSAQTHDGKTFNLADRKGRWTVLFFFPKADSPGCTKQACAFRDSVKKVRELNADVFGLSSDDVADLAAFHQKHRLGFTLLADPKLEIIGKFGSKMPVVNYSKRWTFIIGPTLKIESIDRDVDPVADVDVTVRKIRELQGKRPPAA